MGGSVGGALTPYHSLAITQAERVVLSLSNRKVFVYSTPQPGGRIFSLPSNQWKIITTQPRKCHYTSSFQFPPIDSIHNTPSEFTLSSIKGHSYPLLSGLACGSSLDHMSQIVIHSWSQINPLCSGEISVCLFVYGQHLKLNFYKLSKPGPY